MEGQVLLNIKKPELLSPAGDMECLKAAVDFGADAVYLAGSRFGMRTAPKNFDENTLPEAVGYAHEKGVKVYMTCNTVPRNDEIKELPEHIKRTSECGIDAYIVTDIGVLEQIKKYAPQCAIHISTQAGVTNYGAANAFYKLGARRIVAARELSIGELAEIGKSIPSDMEIECFVHGAMCVSFSGRCLLSSYLTGRDSNRGDCAQPCRWKYRLVEETRPGEYFPINDGDDGTYILNARDMCMINHIPELVNAGVTSFKIEGRAKSAYYVATITNAYRAAIDGYLKNPSANYVPEKWISDEVYKVSFREYCTGFFFGAPNENAEIFYDGGYKREWNVMAIVTGSNGEFVTAEQRNRFFSGDELEVLEQGKAPFNVNAVDLQTLDGEALEAVPHPKMQFRFRCNQILPEGAILRKHK